MQAEKRRDGQTTSAPHWQELLTEGGLDLDVVLQDLPRVGNNALPTTLQTRMTSIQQSISLLTEPGQLVELRILGIHGKKRTDSGYFNNASHLAKAALHYDGKAEGLYITLNPINPALLARANNRVKEYAEHTTSDNDIVKRINLPIDFDPVRPAGISSTETEHLAALQRAWGCRAWLTAQGWPEPVFASSGNGAHLIYAIDLPNDTASTELVKRSLRALSALFSDEQVKVDASTSNASRIFKLYGTLACKGDSTPERPHRRATLLRFPAEPRQLVNLMQLTALGAMVPETLPGPNLKSQAPKANAHGYGKAALEKELAVLAATGDGNRNNQLFQSAASLFSLVAGQALDGAEVAQALLDNARVMGLPETEAKRTIDSGAKRGLSQPRLGPKVAPAPSDGTADGNPHALVPPTKQQSASVLMHVDDLDHLPPLRWLLKDIIPANGLVEVYGAPGCGKTQVIFDMAQTLAASGQTVIYVVAEGLQGYRNRKRAWQQFRKQPGGNLYIWGEPVHLFEVAAVQAFIQAVQDKQPALIVFDTLSRCILGADENDQKDMGFVLESLDTVRRQTGATVVAVHHSNATGVRERGSTVIRGGADAMLEIARDDDRIMVSCAKMKDADEFAPIALKPVLVDIGEEKPVPVLIPAGDCRQTGDDKLTLLQLEILKAVGLEMFAESGIRSSQLDELLPVGTKRASKYHSLNTLIRLGYIDPHVKGDPYCMTEAGRLKLSKAEKASQPDKSNESKASPMAFIWTVPGASPMSSPIPHTFRCGMDETSDQAVTPQTTAGGKAQDKVGTDRPNAASTPQPVRPMTVASQVPSQAVEPPSTEPTGSQENTDPGQPSLARSFTEQEIARYAVQARIPYPTCNGAELYQIASLVPRQLRKAFEEGLGEAIIAYRDEVGRRGEPLEQPIPDVLGLYILPGLVPASELYEGYQRAWRRGHGQAFLTALRQRSEQAAELLRTWVNGRRTPETVFIAHAHLNSGSS